MSDLNRALIPTDEVLMGEVREGARDAFGTLVTRYQNPITNYLTGMLRNREKAKDLAQETFLRAYRAAPRYQPTAPFKTWLYTIATNLAISEMRRQRRWGLVMFKPGAEEGADDVISRQSDNHTATPDVPLMSQEIITKVREAIQSLPEKYRTVVALRDLQELSYDEISQIAGCPLGTVKSRVNRGRLILKDRLKEYVQS